MNAIMSTFSNWQPADMKLGPKSESNQMRENERRRALHELCGQLEGTPTVFFLAVVSAVIAGALTILVCISPFEDITFCRRFFMVLSSGFLFNQTFFLVNVLRDQTFIPTYKGHKKADEGHGWEFTAMRCYPEAYILKRLTPQSFVTGTNFDRGACWKTMEGHMRDHPTGLWEKFCFFGTCIAIVVSQIMMEASTDSKILLIESSCYLLSTSLNLANVWRDRFGSKVWKYLTWGEGHEPKSLTQDRLVYCMSNIMQGSKAARTLMKVWIVIGVVDVVCLVFTMVYLKEIAKGDHEAGCGLVSASIVVIAVFAFVLAYLNMGGQPDWHEEEEKHMGVLGGMLPLMATLIVALGLGIAGIILFKINMTQTLCLVMGELILCDCIFNWLKLHFKTKKMGDFCNKASKDIGFVPEWDQRKKDNGF